MDRTSAGSAARNCASFLLLLCPLPLFQYADTDNDHFRSTSKQQRMTPGREAEELSILKPIWRVRSGLVPLCRNVAVTGFKPSPSKHVELVPNVWTRACPRMYAWPLFSKSQDMVGRDAAQPD